MFKPSFKAQNFILKSKSAYYLLNTTQIPFKVQNYFNESQSFQNFQIPLVSILQPKISF